MRNVEPQVSAGSDVKLNSGGQIVANMLKQEGIKRVFGGLYLPWIEEIPPPSTVVSVARTLVQLTARTRGISA